MNITNIYKSVQFVDFINNLDNLINELLYSKESGFVYKKSKIALDESQKVLDKFNFESSKIIKNVSYKTVADIIRKKKEIFCQTVKKHCIEQLFVWLDEVFQEMIDNSLFEISLDKKNIDEIYNRCISAIYWYSDIKALDSLQIEALLNDFEEKFKKAFNSSDEDYLPTSSPLASDSEVFMKILTLVLENEDKFIQLDLSKYESRLSNVDLKYLINLQNDFNTYLKTSIKDDILLVKTAFEILNLRDSQDKYDFIKQILNDFSVFKNENQNKILAEDKIALVKKRMKLFSKNNLKSCSYFKDLLSFRIHYFANFGIN